MRKTIRTSSIVIPAFIGLLIATPAWAQEFKTETFDAPPPAELAAPVREALGSAGVRVVGLDGPLCEIWLRGTVPAKADAPQKMGVAHPQFEEGTLFGALRILREARDFRKQLVKPGVYTMRYALHPVDGNHMGVSPIRDFLLLLPTSEDAEVENKSKVDTVNLSKKAIGQNHPSVWSLTASEAERPDLPTLVHQEEENLWVLYFRIQVQSAGGAPTQLLLGLVVVGHAPEA